MRKLLKAATFALICDNQRSVPGHRRSVLKIYTKQYTLREAARIVNLGESTLRRKCKNNEIDQCGKNNSGYWYIQAENDEDLKRKCLGTYRTNFGTAAAIPYAKMELHKERLLGFANNLREHLVFETLNAYEPVVTVVPVSLMGVRPRRNEHREIGPLVLITNSAADSTASLALELIEAETFEYFISHFREVGTDYRLAMSLVAKTVGNGNSKLSTQADRTIKRLARTLKEIVDRGVLTGSCRLCQDS